MKHLPNAAFSELAESNNPKEKGKPVSTSIKGMLRSQKGDKRGIYVRVTINREHEYYPTGYYVAICLRLNALIMVNSSGFLKALGITSILLSFHTERKTALCEREEYIKCLEKLMFMVSHRLREPITQIIGVSSMLEKPIDSQNELQQIVGYMKESLKNLDAFTKNLTLFIYKMAQIEKEKLVTDGIQHCS